MRITVFVEFIIVDFIVLKLFRNVNIRVSVTVLVKRTKQSNYCKDRLIHGEKKLGINARAFVTLK